MLHGGNKPVSKNFSLKLLSVTELSANKAFDY